MNAKHPSDNSYIIDVGSAAETARLYDQDRFFTEAMGGLLPEPGIFPEGIRNLLDIGCGSAWWTNEVAFRYPQMRVIGIDLDEATINYARAHARVQGLDNVAYYAMDARQPLDFETDRFELVNVRLAVCFLDREAWPRLIGECLRILRPGGLLRLTEAETMLTTSPSLHRLNQALYQALFHDGRTFSLDGFSLGITHLQGWLMEQAGCTNIQKRAFTIDASTNKPSYGEVVQNSQVFYQLAKPFLLRQGVLSEASFDALYQEMLLEVLQPDFVSLTYGLTTWGSKPKPAVQVGTKMQPSTMQTGRTEYGT